MPPSANSGVTPHSVSNNFFAQNTSNDSGHAVAALNSSNESGQVGQYPAVNTSQHSGNHPLSAGNTSSSLEASVISDGAPVNSVPQTDGANTEYRPMKNFSDNMIKDAKLVEKSDC